MYLGGFEEKMTVYEDFVHVSSHEGVPFCCSKRCCRCCCCEENGIWSDEDNYFLLIENINFIECGSEYFGPFDTAAKFFLRTGLFFLLVEWLFAEPAEVFLAVFAAVFEEHGASTGSSPELQSLTGAAEQLIAIVYAQRYIVCLVSFVSFVFFRLLAGNCLKRGYVSLHCLPGGTERGRQSAYVGNVPLLSL